MITDFKFRPGDTVDVFEKIKEGEKTRLQKFEGIVLGIRGRGENKSFTVRKLVGRIAVEKIFPISSPNIEKVTIKEHPKKKVTRAKFYYLRTA